MTTALTAVLTAAATALATAGAVVASVPPAAAVEFGGNVGAAPNTNFGCEAGPRLVNQFGDYGLVPSGMPSCSFFQVLPIGRNGGAPLSEGRATMVRVRSGPNPAPLRFVVMQARTGITPDGRLIPGSTQCCFGGPVSRTFRLRPNGVTTVPLNLPMRNGKNLQQRLAITDYIGFSATSGTGALPLRVTQPPNTNQYATPGNPAVRSLYPEIRPGQVRINATDAPSHLMTAQFTFCGVNRPLGRVAAQRTRGRNACGGTVRTGSTAARRGAVKLRLGCVGACSGTVQLQRARGKGSLSKKRRFNHTARNAFTVRVPLNRAGKRATRGRSTVRARVVVRSQGTTTRKVIRVR